MKTLILIFALLLSGCAMTPEQHKQHMHEVNMKYNDYYRAEVYRKREMERLKRLKECVDMQIRVGGNTMDCL